MTEATMVIPTRHRPELLEATLLSLRTAACELERGSRHRIRLLVVDDAPDNDDTRDLARSVGVDYERITDHDGRNDPGAAIKLGFSLVDTEYQSLFGDDDIALPRHFRLAFQELDEGIDVVSNSFHVVDENLAVTATVTLKPTGVADLIDGRTLLNDGSFVRSSLVRPFDLDVSLEAHMLPPMWASIMLAGSTFGQVEEPTWLYRRHLANISHSALSERDLLLRRRSNDEVRRLVTEALGEFPTQPPTPVVAKTEVVTASEDDDAVSAPDSASAPSPVPPVAKRGVRYRVLNKLSRSLRAAADAAQRAQTRGRAD